MEISSKRVGPVALAALIGLSLVSPLPAAAPREAEIAQSIRTRLDAYRDGNATLWATHVDDDCLCAAETKAAILRSMANRPSGVKSWYGDLLDLQVHLYSDVAVVRYRVWEFTEVDGQRSSLEQWRTETHLRRAGRWVLVAAAENPIVPDPEPVAVPRAILARYVGTYEYTPGSVDTVTLEGDHLFVQPTGEPKVEILPEDSTTFFAKGQGWRLVFRSDSQGAVTSVLFRQQGQEYVARRLP